MKGWILKWPALAWVVLGAVSPSWSAQLGTVKSEEAQLHEAPDLSSKVLETLHKNDRLAAGNQPIGEYYKVRTKSGTVGWIFAESLDFVPASPLNPANPANSPNPANSEKGLAPQPRTPASQSIAEPPKPKEARKQKRVPAGESNQTTSDSSFLIRLLGGMSFYSSADAVPLAETLGPGFYAGGELGWMFSKSFGIILRGEYVFSSMGFETAGLTYQIDVNSLPVMLGVEWAPLQLSFFSLRLLALGGYSFQTGLKSTASNGVAASVAEVSDSHFTALGALIAQFKFTSWLSAFLEGGYRYSVSNSLAQPSPPGTGGLVLASNFALNLSGPVAGAGVCLTF